MLRTKVRYALVDLFEQDLADETIYDIVGGELMLFPWPTSAHAAAVVALLTFHGEGHRIGDGLALTAPLAVAFDYAERGMGARDVLHPDILFVREARRSILGEWCVEAAPDLIVEVLSRTTRGLELPGGAKHEIYERYGVAHYWTVDVDARTITQYELRNGVYVDPLVLRSGDTLKCPLFAEITRPVAQIFSGLD